MISFFVPGVPKTAGSKRAFYNQKLKRAIIVDSCKTGKDWRHDVQAYARQAYQGPLLTGALRVVFTFHMPRPKAHFRTGKHANELRPDAPLHHTSKPDALKMSRAVEDALTNVVWTDDSLIAEETLRKVYSDRPGAMIEIFNL